MDWHLWVLLIVIFFFAQIVELIYDALCWVRDQLFGYSEPDSDYNIGCSAHWASKDVHYNGRVIGQIDWKGDFKSR